MKFLDIESLSLDDENIACDLFENSLKEYDKYFETIKHRFSKSFLRLYFNNQGFHDWFVINVSIESDNNKISNVFVDIKDMHAKKYIRVKYHGVNKFQQSFNAEHFEKYSWDTYGYDEFIEHDNNLLSHEVFFPSGSFYKIYFKSISAVFLKD